MLQQKVIPKEPNNIFLLFYNPVVLKYITWLWKNKSDKARASILD